MIFKQWQQVLDGSKTQTRRPVREYEEFWQAAEWQQAKGNILGFVYPDSVINTRGVSFGVTGPLIKWQVGRTYAVQPGMSKKAVGRIKLTAIRRESLRLISLEDARMEIGDQDLQTILPFRELWQNCYASTIYAWEENPAVWVLTFELVESITTA